MMKALTRPFEIKEHSEDGSFTGYGSVFDVVDAYREVVLPGAFTDSIAAHKEKGSMPVMLWQHKSDEPIGVWDSIKEDDHGLRMSGHFVMGTQRGREAHSLLRAKAIRGLSIGYNVPQGGAEFDDEKNVTNLKQIELWETSLVTFPANPESMVTEIRAVLEEGIYPEVRDVEKALQDAGFSRGDARIFINEGYRSLLTQDADGAIALQTLQSVMR